MRAVLKAVASRSEHRAKESEKVVLQKFPSAANLNMWRADTIRQVINASGRHDASSSVGKWIGDLLYNTDFSDEKFDELGKDAPFQTLDGKIATAMWGICRANQTVYREMVRRQMITQKTSPYLPLSGQQAIWVMMRHFNTDG